MKLYRLEDGRIEIDREGAPDPREIEDRGDPRDLDQRAPEPPTADMDEVRQ